MISRMSVLVVTTACVAAVTIPHATSAQQPKIRTLTEQEMVDMMVGTSIQSSRANNSANLIKRVKAAIAEGKKFTMVDLADLPDDWMVVSPGALGGGGAWEYVVERTAKQNLPVVTNTKVNGEDKLVALPTPRTYMSGKNTFLGRLVLHLSIGQAY